MDAKVLTVVDDPVIRDLLSCTLFLEGYHVDCAMGADEAVERAAGFSPDVIIVANTAIRDTPPWRFLNDYSEFPGKLAPIVLLTPNNLPPPPEKMAQFRLTLHHMSMPYDLDRFLELVDACLKG